MGFHITMVMTVIPANPHRLGVQILRIHQQSSSSEYLRREPGRVEVIHWGSSSDSGHCRHERTQRNKCDFVSCFGCSWDRFIDLLGLLFFVSCNVCRYTVRVSKCTVYIYIYIYNIYTHLSLHVGVGVVHDQVKILETYTGSVTIVLPVKDTKTAKIIMSPTYSWKSPTFLQSNPYPNSWIHLDFIDFIGFPHLPWHFWTLVQKSPSNQINQLPPSQTTAARSPLSSPSPGLASLSPAQVAGQGSASLPPREARHGKWGEMKMKGEKVKGSKGTIIFWGYAMDFHRIQKKTKVVNRISIEYIMRINGMYPSIMGYELVVVALMIYYS